MPSTSTHPVSTPEPELFNPAGYARLIGSPRGRAFHLSWMAQAEESDEGVFDHMIAQVDVPELNKLVRMHADDERRHAELLRGCAARAGVTPDPIPDHLYYIQRIRSMSATELASVVTTEQTAIMAIFAMLQVVEERGVRQFPMVEDALRRVDVESADVLAGIIRDERRHVGYARAISRRYAPDEATIERTIELCRDIEARAFVENEREYLRFAVEHDLLAGAPTALAR